MAPIGTITFKGRSGPSYKFRIYPWGTRFKARGGVYLFTRRIKNARGTYGHAIVYVGQAADLQQRFRDQPGMDRFSEQGANCMCVRREDAEPARQKMKSALIRVCHPACTD